MTVLALSSFQSLAATDFRARWIAAPAAALGSRERARTLLAEGRLVLDPNAPHPAEEALWFARAARALSGRFGWGLLWELRLIGDLEAWAVRVVRGEHRDLALGDDGLPRSAISSPCVHLAALWCELLVTLAEAGARARRGAWRRESERAAEGFADAFWCPEERLLRAVPGGRERAGIQGLVVAAVDPPLLHRMDLETVVEAARGAARADRSAPWTQALLVEAELRLRDLSLTSLRGLDGLLRRRGSWNGGGTDPITPLLASLASGARAV